MTSPPSLPEFLSQQTWLQEQIINFAFTLKASGLLPMVIKLSPKKGPYRFIAQCIPSEQRRTEGLRLHWTSTRVPQQARHPTGRGQERENIHAMSGSFLQLHPSVPGRKNGSKFSLPAVLQTESGAVILQTAPQSTGLPARGAPV